MREQEQKFIEEALPQLQPYLLSDELYWSLGSNLPRLTPGNLLLSLKRLEAVNPLLTERERLKLESLQTRWRIAWEKKIIREMTSRLRSWLQFLEEQARDEAPSRAHYAASVRERAILQLLQPTWPPLTEADLFLRARFRPGAFVWEAVYQPVFPESEFWFLYGSLQRKEVLNDSSRTTGT
ncbi:MAG: hypothetical protein N2117_01025 [Anaerolineales bacterium]|nr:hypothetical protein [Anaerolineales bacterium]MCX7753813.1 hypothetical protein [Anaerolineales bacterium]MDW8276409.1 hypothetical protein [Anaerolineales bacterium]